MRESKRRLARAGALKASALLAVDHYREVSLGSRVPPQVVPFQRLEPHEAKVSRTVLRGERGRKAPALL